MVGRELGRKIMQGLTASWNALLGVMRTNATSANATSLRAETRSAPSLGWSEGIGPYVATPVYSRKKPISLSIANSQSML
jgi:hypothetical protein